MKLSRRTLLIVLAVAFGSIVGVRIISRFSKSAAPHDDSEQTLVVRVEKIAKGEVIDQIKISGTVKPVSEVEIFPKLAGRVISAKFNVGDRVDAGDVLAVIEHQEYQLQERSARASLAMAKTNENAARNDLERARELFLERAMAKTELEAIEQKYDVAKAQAMSAMAQADIAAQQIRNAQITSLISGTVTKRNANLGAHVTPQAPVFAVQDLSKLKLVTSVDAATLVRLKKGVTATIIIEQFQLAVTGRISSLAPSLDAQSRRAEVEIELADESGKLVPNMFVDGNLVLNKLNDTLVVPTRAFDPSTPEPRLFRIVNGKVEVVSPRLGQRDQQHAQIIDGLKEGDVVAVSGLDRLRDGSPVTIEVTK